MEALIILALFIVFAVFAALFGQDSRDDFTRDYKGLTHLSSPHH